MNNVVSPPQSPVSRRVSFQQRFRYGLALLIIGQSINAQALVPPGYQAVAKLYQVPEQYVYAIALHESGKRLNSQENLSRAIRPWPWTLNVEGKGYFYPSRKACWIALTRFLAQGRQRVDIGLMQVNWYYHQEKLGDPWRALDPYVNLQVGARILRHEYALTQDWYQALGRYHSPGQNSGQRQRARHYADGVLRRIKQWVQRS